jgi:hypothetical protein
VSFHGKTENKTRLFIRQFLRNPIICQDRLGTSIWNTQKPRGGFFSPCAGLYGGSIFTMVLWLYWLTGATSLSMGIFHILRGEVQRHRSWMSVNYGTTMGAGFLRLFWACFAIMTPQYKMDQINAAAVLLFIPAMFCLAVRKPASFCMRPILGRRFPCACPEPVLANHRVSHLGSHLFSLFSSSARFFFRRRATRPSRTASTTTTWAWSPPPCGWRCSSLRSSPLRFSSTRICCASDRFPTGANLNN